jgi:peptide deformylase
VPDLTFEIVRPKLIHLVGIDLDGNEVSIEADELEARLFQHELDHLDGVLIVDHLDEDQRREAQRFLRERTLTASMPEPAGGGLRLF